MLTVPCTLLTALQTTVCFGLVTPLFVSYVLEARAKLRFAQQWGLMPSANANWRPILYDMLIQRSFVDVVALALLYFNIILWANVVVVGVVTATVNGFWGSAVANAFGRAVDGTAAVSEL